MLDPRTLAELQSVGPRTAEDLAKLGIARVEDLRGQDAHALWERLCRESGVRHDPCVEDVLAAAIAQAEDPELPAERRTWWYWSRVRRQRPDPARN